MGSVNKWLIPINRSKVFKQVVLIGSACSEINDGNDIAIKLFDSEADIVERTFGNKYKIQSPDRYNGSSPIFVVDNVEKETVVAN